METKTHWKKLQNPDYIGAYCLMETGKPVDMNVTIESVSNKKVKNMEGKEEDCTVATLKGKKPMILNATNSKTLCKLAKSPFIEDWAGLTVTLYVASVKAFGDVVDALRIRTVLPTQGAPLDTTKAITSLSAATSLDELVAAWNGLTVDEKNAPSVLAKKDQMKLTLTPKTA